MSALTIEDLRKVIALSKLPDEHLRWLLDRVQYDEYEDGTPLMKTGEPVDEMMIILEGKLAFYMEFHGRNVYYFTFENDITTGGVGALLPYSRMKLSPGNSFANGKLKVVRLHKKYFHELEQLNPEFIQQLIGYMTERARAFATTQLQHEKVNALGQLAAGIAHELNNPAAAINRISNEINKRLKRNYELTARLIRSKINPEYIDYLRRIVEEKETSKPDKIKLTTMQRLRFEDEIADWMELNGVEENRQPAETFAEFGFTIEELENILKTIGKESLIDSLHWLDNILSSQRLIKDLDDASCRISNLVGAIKSHVHMDRTNDLQPTDIHKDIENTLTLLGHKLRDKNIEVIKKYCNDMPKISVYIGELNQVWTNLIDNSLFAMEKNGKLTIETSCDAKNIKVCIIDDGSGIPKEILSRIFDPFFTTKKVGEGTGIGLDLVNRIIKRHNGEIKVNSVPGRTEFSICLPLLSKEETK